MTIPTHNFEEKGETVEKYFTRGCKVSRYKCCQCCHQYYESLFPATIHNKVLYKFIIKGIIIGLLRDIIIIIVCSLNIV